MTNRINHSSCRHPKTSAARAKCRAEVAAFFALTPEEQAAKDEADACEAAEKRWEALRAADTSHPGQVLSAELNADDTSVEEGFEVQTRRWYEVAYSTLAMLLDTGENNYPETTTK